jgi:serine/threonine protein kinase
MYAVGMLFYKLVTGAPPHMSDSSTQMLEYQTENPTPPLPEHIPDHVKPVFHRMISNDPDRRPTPTRVISVLDLLQSTT